jgi:D-alanyl-D-alanine carboxypeptidase
MKLTKEVIKQFEQEQKDYGTKTALFNIIWQIAGQLMTDIGVKGIKTKGYNEKK